MFIGTRLSAQRGGLFQEALSFGSRRVIHGKRRLQVPFQEGLGFRQIPLRADVVIGALKHHTWLVGSDLCRLREQSVTFLLLAVCRQVLSKINDASHLARS